MEKIYIVRDFYTQLYYCGKDFGWFDDPKFSECFESIEEAENFMKSENGVFQLETIYKAL